ncbi:MAG TPA: TonB-dependent receptor, partial [Woeseiaceae bacterium]|nr:TonB-dependent receptor [Woeseiaceae bacterium]
ANEVPVSLSVLTGDQIRESAQQHFEELVNLVPNLSWSGDGHRARYFQIRGIGELEQYEGAPNPSVGFLIDDIDFSGIGTVGTLFDMESVEVLRGPQGSRYGANALAGLVYMRSTLPSAARDGRLQLTVGDDDTRALGLAFGGKLGDDERALYRFSVHDHESNGFRDNLYLGREDTNGRDETSVRLRLHFAPSDALDVNIAALYTDINNGYDAFALDNGYTMLSDRPGKDAQESAGLSLRFDWNGPASGTLTSISAYADSQIEFSFDADWGNDDSWDPVTYDYVSLTDRDRQTLSQEFRFVADNWLVGVYALKLTEDLDRRDEGDYYDPFYDWADSLAWSFGSRFESTNLAGFGQTEWQLGARTRLSAGLRAEHRSTDYSDTDGQREDPSENMWGGELSMQHDFTENVMGYASLSRGYKAGGFNLGPVPPGFREFDDEVLWTLEAGVKATLADNRLHVNAAAFFSRRDDQQVRISEQLNPNDPASFVFFTINDSEGGEASGLEVDLRWYPTDALEIYSSLGLLRSKLGDSSRDLAHAPRYSVAAGAIYRHTSGFFARIDTTASDKFYFDVSHDQESESYALVHARLGFENENWRAYVYGRNLTDEYYAVRGFYFGNEPPDFPATLYTRAGDPRHMGLTVERRFH